MGPYKRLTRSILLPAWFETSIMELVGFRESLLMDD
jgi:hypothetical protein